MLLMQIREFPAGKKQTLQNKQRAMESRMGLIWGFEKAGRSRGESDVQKDVQPRGFEEKDKKKLRPGPEMSSTMAESWSATAGGAAKK